MNARALIAVVFFLSGATSLVYQVAWVRALSLFFGSDVHAASITLGVFMGGLSLGSFLGGRFGDRLRRPLLAYGLLELGIAASALSVPRLLSGLEGSYQHVYRAYFETAPWLYQGFRFVAAAGALLVPTALMGATLPFIVRQFADRQDELGRSVGFFYALNTLGALLGTVLTGFVLLPALGLSRTVQIAVVTNAAIGAVAVWTSLRLAAPSMRDAAVLPATSLDSLDRRVLLVAALSGFGALALEVVWMRILVQSFSATVYAFSVMLASFLFGIYYGSREVGKNLDAHRDAVVLLAKLQLGLAATVALLAVATYIVPRFFGRLVWGLTSLSGGAFGPASVAAQLVVAFVLIVIPTVLLGATFPTAVKIYTRSVEARARGTGATYAANTLGALLGALTAGLVLIPLLGAQASLVAVGCVFLVAGASLPFPNRWRSVGGALAAVLVASVASAFLPRAVVANYGLMSTTAPELLYHGEGVSHTVDILKTPRGHTLMMVNGNVEADTSLTQRRHFILKAHLPLLIHADPRDVAVVGLGLGITLRAIDRHPTVRRIRLIEISPEMVEAHERLGDVSGNVLRSPRLRLRIDDGRNFMAMTDETFDMTSADPIHPRITGVGYLYTREYYEQIRKRLRPDGVVLQWMPMYNIAPPSFDVAFRTFAAVYENASFWYVRGHGLFVATLGPFSVDYASLAARFADPRVAEDFASVGIDSPEALLGHLLMDAEHVARYVGRSPDQELNTDDNAYLEYRTPFEFLGGTEAIVRELLPYAGWDMDTVLKNAPAGVQARIREAFERRREKLLAELSLPFE